MDNFEQNFNKDINLETSKPIEIWNKNEIEEYTIKSIKNILKHVYANNQFYHDKFDKSGISIEEIWDLDRFQSVPFVTKEELRENPFSVLSVPKEMVAQIHLSTGTTGGKSIYMMHTHNDLFKYDISHTMPILFPIEKGEIVFNALPYEMSSSGASFHRFIRDAKHAAVVGVGKGGYYSEPIKTLKAMVDLKADQMISVPSYVMNLIEVAKQNDIDISKDIKLKKIWLTGEGCSNEFRKRIEKEWNCKAYFYYGSLEGGNIGIECETQDGYHITNGHVYVEIIDNVSGRNKPYGEIGEIVITTLLREGSPLIRFRTGDLGFIDDKTCECGMSLKKLYLRGRKENQICIHGNFYSPMLIEENLMRFDEVGNDYRIIVYNDYIEIVVTRGLVKCTSEENLKISEYIKHSVGIPNKIKFVDEMKYLGGKIIRVINKQSQN